LFNDLSTAWVFFAIFVGIIILLLFAVIYDVISLGWIVINVYGNDHYLLAFISGFYGAWQLGYAPGDVEM
ncbi:hypothetical protein DFJ58DRAFT_669624, partial [Suillus subalutaceus]|uniref:uncharacterized protein n=1 Tax=Suillus subalutaceus TaxID=48586 RepID=UPI001B85D849